MTTPFDGTTAGGRIDRRTALKWVLTAAAAAALPGAGWSAEGGPPPSMPPGVGYGTDPDLLKDYKPGELWPLSFSAMQRETAAALCDVILPADGQGPAASAVGVPAFLDEWISAPYPGHPTDKQLILEGLEWIEAEAQRRFRIDFVNLGLRQKHAICDDICFAPKAKPEFRTAAQFFRRFRDLAAGGYYTTPEGMKAIGYTGNVAIEKFEGPTPDVLKRLGLA